MVVSSGLNTGQSVPSPSTRGDSSRIENRWQGKGTSGTAYNEIPHLYARDLDLFGPGSLFELLCTARTRSGEDTLARWLRTPASPAEILRRQEAVEELRNRVDLREDLALLGPDVRSTVDPEFITRWATAPLRLSSAAARMAAAILVAWTGVMLIYWGVLGGNASFLYYSLIAEAVFGLLYRRRVREVLATIDEPAKELAILGLALAPNRARSVFFGQVARVANESREGGKTALRGDRVFHKTRRLPEPASKPALFPALFATALGDSVRLFNRGVAWSLRACYSSLVGEFRGVRSVVRAGWLRLRTSHRSLSGDR